jgi:hypothetical protein
MRAIAGSEAGSVDPRGAGDAGRAGADGPPTAAAAGLTGALAGGSRVAERIAWFYAVHPRGRIVTDLVTRAREVAVFRAAVYRADGDAQPAATGWSAGNPAGGAALERVEEAAVGRALANLGFAAPSAAAEAGRAGLALLRAADGVSRGTGPAAPPAAAPVPDAAPAPDAAPVPNAVGGPHAPAPTPPAADGRPGAADAGERERRVLAADLAPLIASAVRHGVRPRRAAAWRLRLRAGADGPDVLRAAERRLRAWVERRRADPYGGAV